MKAKIINPKENGKNYGDKKETMNTYKLIAFYKGEFHELITCRTYMARSSQASVVYASIWVSRHGRIGKGELYCAGHGSAGGYGYHKSSAAIGEAINNAGIELYGSAYYVGKGDKEDFKKVCSISGVGDTAIDSALLAIGKALGFNKLHLVKG